MYIIKFIDCWKLLCYFIDCFFGDMFDFYMVDFVVGNIEGKIECDCDLIVIFGDWFWKY